MAEPTFQVGAHVFLASAGLGKVLSFAGRDADGKPGPLAPGAEPAFYVIALDESVACVPLAAVKQLRVPVDSATATQMLETLRAVDAPASLPEPILEKGKRVVHEGEPLAAAGFLRELYALPAPLAESVVSGVVFLSKLVLTELAWSLRTDRGALEQEMRARYPAAQDALGRP